MVAMPRPSARDQVGVLDTKKQQAPAAVGQADDRPDQLTAAECLTPRADLGRPRSNTTGSQPAGRPQTAATEKPAPTSHARREVLE